MKSSAEELRKCFECLNERTEASFHFDLLKSALCESFDCILGSALSTEGLVLLSSHLYEGGTSILLELLSSAAP